MRRLFLPGLLLLAGCAHPTAPRSTVPAAPTAPNNRVVLYLKGAEVQYETREQRAEIRQALTDLSTLPPDALCRRRYADYGLAPGRWSIGQLLLHYVVPNPPQTIPDEPAFCSDAAAPEARAASREFIRSFDAAPLN